MVASAPPAEESRSKSPRLAAAWWDRVRSGSAIGAGYALAAALVGIAVWMASSAPVTGPVGPPSEAIVVVLGLNLILIEVRPGG